MADNKIAYLQERMDAMSDLRAVIEITAGELSAIVEAAQTALIRANSGIYQRGGQLVRIAKIEKDTTHNGVRRSAGSVVILAVSRDYLPLVLARASDFTRYDGRTKSMKRIDPPGAISSALLASAGEWRFPSLAGIVTAPTLRPDATLLDKPGYDVQSRLFAAFDPADFPAINSMPSRHDALAALDTLDGLFSECAFVGGDRSAHASVAIAASITACVRQALGIAPAFAYSAFKAGSGKTTAAKVPAQIALGLDPPVIAPTDDENELKKALLAILIAGDSIVLIDNVTKPVDSAALCAVLTSASYSDRVLGASAKVTVPTAATWLLTGNSIEFVGDLTTRVLLSVLDPECERPEERSFKRNLTEFIAENRGALVAAALTIPLAYTAAGSPAMASPRSRFSDWDRLVRNPLLWLGVADPLVTQADLRENDPEREVLVGVLNSWRDSFGDEPATVAQVIDAANSPGQSANPHLLDAVRAAAGEKNGTINSRRFGRYIKRKARRIESGLRLEFVGTDSFTCRPQYRVSSVRSVSSVMANPSKEIAR